MELTDRGLAEHAKQLNEAVAALIELEAMKAENIARERSGFAPAYGYDQIHDLISEHRIDTNSIIEKYRNFF